LAYASRQESAHQRGLGKSQKIQRRLGGDANMLEEFPDKPKGMHWRTYERWRRLHDAAEERSNIGLMGFVERLGRRTSRRAQNRRLSVLLPRDYCWRNYRRHLVL
jgi:hypothetical protein